VSSKSTGNAGLAGRYATALFELAEERGTLDQVANDLNGLKASIAESEDFQRFISSPVMGREDQEKGAGAIAAKAELTDVTRNFLGLLAKNRRLVALPAIIDAFLSALAERRGEVSADVTVAVAITEKQKTSLAAALKKVTGGEVALNIHVDPSLIGGMIVKIGSHMVDSSIRSQLQRLQLSMKGVG
jgi:F-type H+-transporting ATPase subunit delta